ncbi:DUF418 domain-containing protein [Nonomuraea antimicrobica]|uniref:DUF418 domain-containing protein n=1 Tax=Nonomuraea antimicrobica TaxID=561173 RepID=UPI0031E51262
MSHHPHRETDASPPRPAARPRIAALDVLRGFALCGILLANIKPIANVNADAVLATGGEDGLAWLGLFVDQRFFPIFSLLFGLGFSLLLEKEEERAARPRVVLARRLLVLLAIGLVHMFVFWRGDILTIYAVVGLVVLLPSTWLPRWAVAGLAGVLLAVPLVLGSNGVVLVPGLFLLGSALTRYGVTARMERATWGPAVLGTGFAALAVPAVWLQVRLGEEAGGAVFSTVFAVAGLLVAGAYVCGVLLLLRTPLRPVLQTVFAPLGRMALTNYLGATVIVLVISRIPGWQPESWSSVTVVLVAAGVLGAQRVVSGWWLRRYRFGPMEWLWRWATWLRRPPLARGRDSLAS